MAEEKKKKDKKSGGGKSHGIFWVFLVVLMIIIVLVLFRKDIFPTSSGEITTVTESQLTKVIRENQVRTAAYPYNSYVAVKDDDGNVEYYVAYDGNVKAGFDLKDVKVSINDNNVISIQLPKMAVQEIKVEPNSLEYIFENKKYNTETVAGDAYHAAEEDLKAKAADDEDIIQAATDNAKMMMKELVEPWVNQVSADKQYEVRVLAYGEDENGSITSGSSATQSAAGEGGSSQNSETEGQGS